MARVRAALLECPEAFHTVLFRVDPTAAFMSAGIEVIFYGDPDVVDHHPEDSKPLAPNAPSLLPADRDFPIGRHDLCGLNTTGEFQEVVDTVSSVLQELWNAEADDALAEVEFFAGWTDWEPGALEGRDHGDLLDLRTGETRFMLLGDPESGPQKPSDESLTEA